MQSGITASPSLRHAFTALLSDPSQFALLITIANEQLVPLDSLPTTTTNTSSPSSPPPSSSSSSSFHTSLPLLRPHLLPHRALYILLRLPTPSPPTLAAITYIPPAAPVRQKMLFASTRLALARDLGPEHFATQLLATEEAEVLAVGVGEGEQDEEKPWSREEEVLGRVRRMEEEEVGTGMGRRGHLDVDLGLEGGGGGKGLVVEEGARGGLKGLVASDGDRGTGLVMLVCVPFFGLFGFWFEGGRECGMDGWMGLAG